MVTKNKLKPFVSIITPIHNGVEDVLKECIIERESKNV
jgi:hypothetical protein